MNKFETILSKIGTESKKVVSVFFTKVLPGAVKVAQEAEPFVSALEPAFGPEFAIVTNAVASAETAGALAGQSGATSEQKMAQVIAAVTPQLLPTLTAQGLESKAAQAAIETYSQAVVTVLNTFPAPAPAPAPPVAPVA